MIKINKGPMLQRFAETFGQELDFDGCEALDDVVQWVSEYVNGPWPQELLPYLEQTERERFDSIKQYILMRLENSTAGRIKAQLANERNAA